MRTEQGEDGQGQEKSHFSNLSGLGYIAIIWGNHKTFSKDPKETTDVRESTGRDRPFSHFYSFKDEEQIGRSRSVSGLDSPETHPLEKKRIHRLLFKEAFQISLNY